MPIAMLVVQGRPKGKCLRFARGDYLIGRGAECQLRPNSSWVSRQHCILRITDAGAYIRDLGSTNGTLVNGVRVTEEQQLSVGDRLQVGPLVLELLDHVPRPTELAAAQELGGADVDNVSQTQSDFDASGLDRADIAHSPRNRHR